MKQLTLLRMFPAVLLGIAVSVCITPAFAVDNNGAFELDGDADEEVALGDDWETLDGGGGGQTTFTFIVDKNGTDDIFTGGGSKTPNDPEDWLWKSSPPPPDKDNITHAYAANYMVSGDQIVYFGADLFADNGDAELAFWFFQNKVSPVGLISGGFEGHHTDGDVYVAVKFSNGGTNATGTIYEWWSACDKAVKNPGAGDCAADNIRVRIVEANALCDGSGLEACVITNTGSVDSPWSYTPKSGTPDVFPPTTFFEGGINIKEIFGENKCFASFMASTGASTSFTSTAKDFALGDFDVCSVAATKECVNDTEADDAPYDLNFNVRGCAWNDGGGSINVLSLVNSVAGDPDYVPADLTWYEPPLTFDPAVDCENESALFLVTESTGTVVNDPSVHSLAAGDALVYYFTEWTNLTGPSDEVTIVAEGTDGAPIAPESATDKCPDQYFPAALHVVKSCTGDLEADTDRIVVRINVSGQVCNDGDIALTALSLFDSTPLSELVVLTPDTTALQPGECTDYYGHYYPASIPTGDSCPFTDQVTVTAEADPEFTDPNSPGCVDIISAYECTAVSNSPTCLLRATDGDGDCATGPVNPE